MRPFPGTWGSLPPVVLAGLLYFSGLGPNASPVVFNSALLVVLVVFSLACVQLGDRAEARFGRKDPSEVVADETAGQVLPLLFLPGFAFATPPQALWTLWCAFVVFRVFDIIKIWPADGLQKHPAGWGILLDDVAAGAWALVAMQLLVRVMYPNPGLF